MSTGAPNGAAGAPDALAAALAQRSATPELSFGVEGAEPVEFAAVPTLRFRLRVASAPDTRIRSLTLNVQLRIAATRRTYDAATQARLLELFGPPAGWGRALRDLLWTQVTLVVPAFTGSTVVDLPVTCTYDFDAVASKYLDAVRDATIPLELLFSGTIFHAGEDGALRAGQVPWDCEASFRMPISLWQETMERHFPGSAWMRLGRDAFDRLCAYKAARALLTWDDAVEALLAEAERGGP